MNREKQIIQSALAQARRMSQVHGAPQTINLTIYLTDDDLRQLRPEDGPEATCQQQQQLTQTVANALRKDGYRVELIPLRVVDYMKWLSTQNRPNTPANRAAWASWQVNKPL